MEELNEVTRNFSDDLLIGQGPSAKCFLGVLKDGQNVAVKKFGTSEEIQVEIVPVCLPFLTFAVIVLHLLLCTAKDYLLNYTYIAGSGHFKNVLP
jgi:hypothetical protein